MKVYIHEVLSLVLDGSSKACLRFSSRTLGWEKTLTVLTEAYLCVLYCKFCEFCEFQEFAIFLFRIKVRLKGSTLFNDARDTRIAKNINSQYCWLRNILKTQKYVDLQYLIPWHTGVM